MAFVLLGLSMASCTEDIMDDINNDKNHPKDTQAKFIVADLITNTAFSSVGGDFSLYASIYVEQEVGTHNQMYNAEKRNGEPTVATTYNNVWNAAFQNVKNAKIIIDKCSAGGTEEGNDVTLGAGKVLLAYNIAILTDLFGDVPYSEVGIMNANGTPQYMQPKIEKQDDIYKDILTQLDDAIALFDSEDAAPSGPMGAKDFIYSGNAGLWKKAAYGLKARYTMRLLNRAADKTAALNTVLDCISHSFQSAGDEMKFSLYDGVDNSNPFAAFTASRAAMGASQSLLDKFIERNDPRGYQYFGVYNDIRGIITSVVTDPAKVLAAPNGNPVEGQLNYNVSVASGAWSAPTQMLSYHELLFLKAEAECRLSKYTEAKASLLAAITAGFENLANTLNDAWGESDLGPDVADEYFTTSVAPLFDANPLKETMIQKYLAFAGASGEAIEAYNDYRRMQASGENFVELKNPLNTNQFPLRFSYGSSDVLANQNVKAAYGNGQYVYTEKVWWAGGSR